ncbi:putative filamin A-interacting protein 1-like [Sesbania bispinosa]|nr:putative filamin A-interacting protein 1-like [Sesbania bispinosa]
MASENQKALAKRMAKKACVVKASQSGVPIQESSPVPNPKRQKVEAITSSTVVVTSPVKAGSSSGPTMSNRGKGVEGNKLFQNKSPPVPWGAMMGNFFKYVVDELHALPQIKKIEDVSAKLISDEAKMAEALAKVKTITKERDKLFADNVLLQQQLATKTTEKLKATADTRKAASDLELEQADRLPEKEIDEDQKKTELKTDSEGKPATHGGK